jgi:hypothetical protein
MTTGMYCGYTAVVVFRQAGGRARQGLERGSYQDGFTFRCLARVDNDVGGVRRG